MRAKKENVLDTFARKAAFADAVLELVKEHGLAKKRKYGRRAKAGADADGAAAEGNGAAAPKAPRKARARKARPRPEPASASE